MTQLVEICGAVILIAATVLFVATVYWIVVSFIRQL